MVLHEAVVILVLVDPVVTVVITRGRIVVDVGDGDWGGERLTVVRAGPEGGETTQRVGREDRGRSLRTLHQ